jgi:hypothetical protein
MKLANGTLMGIGAVALVASLITILAPKAVRGAVAALVQVANTTAAPALTLDISESALQNVRLSCKVMSPSGEAFCTSQNFSLSPYIVPAGQNLVVTSIDIIGTGGGVGPTSLNFFPGVNPPPNLAGGAWNVSNDGLTHSFQYPRSGVVFPAGYVFGGVNVGINNFGGAALYGFLTPI